jgi:quercetin dioxygenase-like cupin family protein
MMKFALGIATLALLSSVALADDMVTATPQSLKWGPAPNFFEKGSQITVIAGDPFKSGEYTLRLMMPKGYKIAPHFHPTAENVTVIKGTFHIAMGDKLDPKSGTTLKTGGFVSLPAQMHHYAWASGATIVQVHGEGPFAITYINPADDPRNRK